MAVDQRESLRAMLRDSGLPAADADLGGFKVAVTKTLSPSASGLLVDPLFGLGPVLEGQALAPDCGLIVAADRISSVGEIVVGSSEFDERLDLVSLVGAGAVALKLLVLWPAESEGSGRSGGNGGNGGNGRDGLVEMVRHFVDRCAELGVLSLVEGVVRGVEPASDPDGHVRAVIRAAGELTGAGPDLYKAEVPTHGLGTQALIEAACREITATVPCPWVVLSAGTAPDAFPAGVEAACRGGASGFLAGRAIWAPAVAAARDEADLAARLATDALARLERLIAIVDEAARPWSAVA